MFIFLTGLFFLFLIWKHFNWKVLKWPEQGIQVPPYQAHRGFWKLGVQENTIASFEAAFVRGWSMIELDVQLSRDQIPVVFHDSDLRRICGLDKKVSECTADELRQIAQVPQLEDVFKFFGAHQKFNIELKSRSLFNGRLESEISKVILRSGVEKRIVFSSFNPFALLRLSFLLVNVPRLLLVTQEKGHGNNFYLRHLVFAPYVRIHGLNLDYRFLSIEKLKYWKKRNIPISIWTLNDSIQANTYLEAGALSIISDELLNGEMQK